MKTLIAACLLAAIAASPAALAQSGGMKGMEMKDGDAKKKAVKGGKKAMDAHEKCMAMKGMDMDKCMDMMNKGGSKPAAGKAADGKAG